ncbi:MAG: hypothetical protein KKB03_00935 [Nanoarchaeota archaeon]|nr:hypothetical protein [Nanoarchaeota archaeon]MBU1135406.1 hypothetical protein [Nanoarchaeota archaeon]MBU2519794.1 hypothetical protein [Nanoarchaeota archaeon]
MKKKFTHIQKVFYALIVVFLVLVFYFIVPVPTSAKRMFFPIVAVLAILFFILGAVLIRFTLKSKIEKNLKTFLLLTGFSAVGFLVCTLLHNFFYGLAVITEHIILLKYLMESLHVMFFLVSIIVCPILFLIGMIGGIYKFLKK